MQGQPSRHCRPRSRRCACYGAYIGQQVHTFLFSDIEASTRLWEEHPDAMARALERHDTLVHSAIDDCGGRLLKTTGDGAIAVFDGAGDAVGAGVAIQRELNTSDWAETGPIRVRIGIHSGETWSRNQDFFGPTMNRTARIMAAGHGGQILLSGVAATEATPHLTNSTSLRDLGSHRLKDLTDAEHLFQVIHPDLPSAFPDLLTLSTRPNNLPPQTTEFLGRSEELAAIDVMLEAETTRLLTLAGPGGAGKTRLALQVAAEQVNRFDDGVFFVDLSAERDPGSAFEAVVRTLDLPATGDGDPLDLLQARLRDRNMLLVLDNFEQVMAAATGVSALLQSCSRLKVLVTSRETLRVRAERVFPVPPLALADPGDSPERIAQSEAVQLFVERAFTAQPDFELTDHNARTVAEICLRLDGLPLALELAAARLNVFTVSELLARIRDRLDVIGAGGRDLPDRQRTLWGAIGWSYELLEPEEREVFEMMSVFSTARLEALEVVAASGLEVTMVLDHLGSLVDKSLIRRDVQTGATRFSMLAMITEYAQSRLAESSERDRAVRSAHAVYYSEFALGLQDRLRGAERETSLQELATEIGNLRVAWRFWVDEGDLEQLFGLLDGLWALHEAKGWYHSAIELARDMLDVLATAEPTPELAAEELVLRTSLARALMAVRGYGPEVEEAFKSALELAEQSGAATRRFPVLRALASYYTLSGDLAQAVAIGQQLLELGEETGDETMLIEGHYVMGMSISFGDITASLPHLETAIELYDPVRHGSNRFRLGPSTGVVARTAAAMILWLAGDLSRAVSRIAEALSFARAIEHPFSVAYALYHNGYFAIMRGRFDDCLAFARELHDVAGENEYALWQTLSTVLEGVAMAGLGESEEGLAKTESGIDIYQGLTTPPIFWPFLLGLRASVHGLADRPVRGVELIDEALALGATGAGAPPGLHMLKADLLFKAGETDPKSLESLYRSEIEQARDLGLRLVQLQALTRLVTLRRETGTDPDGTNELASTYATFEGELEEHDLVMAQSLLNNTR